MNAGKGIYVGATLISILISLALYFTGKRESAIFVGLWAPTIVNLGQSLLEQFSKRMVPLVETRRVPSLLY
jgi:Na+/melibiose symporter-like transporter